MSPLEWWWLPAGWLAALTLGAPAGWCVAEAIIHHRRRQRAHELEAAARRWDIARSHVHPLDQDLRRGAL